AGLKRARRLPYVRHETLNTDAEQTFAKTLERVVGDRYRLSYKVRMADVIGVRFKRRGKNDKQWWRAFRKISSKHLDVIVSAPHGGHIYLAIELDDSSHARRSRRQRDEFVNQALQDAGVTLVRFRARQFYKAKEVRELLRPYLDLPDPEATAEAV
ncbi:DUF2726 domain-containing protein, partial [Halomonas sp. THAF12]|uniref:DUF2726 domain-containing protein n=1 Tax=Halomonas sp. B23F22_10 TaxID=3459515 RepID=UPI00373F15FF